MACLRGIPVAPTSKTTIHPITMEELTVAGKRLPRSKAPRPK